MLFRSPGFHDVHLTFHNETHRLIDLTLFEEYISLVRLVGAHVFADLADLRPRKIRSPGGSIQHLREFLGGVADQCHRFTAGNHMCCIGVREEILRSTLFPYDIPSARSSRKDQDEQLTTTGGLPERGGAA